MTWAKGKTYLDRFEKHLKGKGGKFLYKAILQYGSENFIVELIDEGDFDYIYKREIKESANTLYKDGTGYNGNTGRAIFNDKETIKLIIQKRKERYNKEVFQQKLKKAYEFKDRCAITEKYKATVSLKSKEDIGIWRKSICNSIRGCNKTNNERIKRQSESLINAWKDPSEKMLQGKIKEARTKTGQTKLNHEGRRMQAEKMMGRFVGAKNSSFKGYWLTPKGKFESAKDAGINMGFIKHVRNIARICLYNRIITKCYAKNSPELLPYVGNSSYEVGFGFVPG